MEKDLSILCCPNCGSTNIQIQAWVHANSKEYIDEIENSEGWCEECEDNIYPIPFKAGIHKSLKNNKKT